MPEVVVVKPLNGKAYGSIGHLPNSRLGSGDHSVPHGQYLICCEKIRDKDTEIIVQEKLDGSCVAVLKQNGVIQALTRAGWPATSSGYEQHKLFHDWVMQNSDRFSALLNEGERVVGEWLAQAHGTVYDLTDLEPFFAFDLMRLQSRRKRSGEMLVEDARAPFDEFIERIRGFQTPTLLHRGGPLKTEEAVLLHSKNKTPCDEIEGVVYRVQYKGCLEYIAKYVMPNKVDGKHFPHISGKPEVWNWRP